MASKFNPYWPAPSNSSESGNSRRNMPCYRPTPSIESFDITLHAKPTGWIYRDPGGPKIFLSTKPCSVRSVPYYREDPQMSEDISIYTISSTSEPMEVDFSEDTGADNSQSTCSGIIVDQVMKDKEGRLIIKYRSRADDPDPQGKLVQYLADNMHTINARGINPVNGMPLEEVQSCTSTSSFTSEVDFSKFITGNGTTAPQLFNIGYSPSPVPTPQSRQVFNFNSSAKEVTFIDSGDEERGNNEGYSLQPPSRGAYSSGTAFVYRWVEMAMLDGNGSNFNPDSLVFPRLSVSDSNIAIGQSKRKRGLDDDGLSLLHVSRSEPNVGTSVSKKQKTEESDFDIKLIQPQINSSSSRKRKRSADGDGVDDDNEDLEKLVDASTLRKAKRRRRKKGGRKHRKWRELKLE